MWLGNGGTAVFTDIATPDFNGPNNNKGGNIACDFDDDGDFDLFYSDGPPGEDVATCQAFIECQRWFEDVYDLPAEDVSGFDEDGACWSSTQEARDACVEACQSSVEQMRWELERDGHDVGACAE